SYGGGALVTGAAALSGGTFQRNQSAANLGGGLHVVGELALTQTQFLSNTATGGGGLSLGGAGTLNGGFFQGNLCVVAACHNGGWLAASALTLTQIITNADDIQNQGLT